MRRTKIVMIIIINEVLCENDYDIYDVFPVPPKRVKIFETGTRRPVSDAVEVGFLKAFNQRHHRHSISCNKISIYFNNMH